MYKCLLKCVPPTTDSKMNWCFFYEQYILINMSAHDKYHLHDRNKKCYTEPKCKGIIRTSTQGKMSNKRVGECMKQRFE